MYGRTVANLLVVGIVAFVALACGDGGHTITKADYGDDWPLTVDDVKLFCDREFMVWIEADGFAYPVNGVAMDWLARIHPDKEIRDFDDIWRENPDLPDTYVGVGGLIDDGLALCTE